MKYMLLVYSDENVLSPAERQDCYVKSAQLTQEIHASGHFIDASPLHLTSAATSIRVRDQKRLVTDADGPRDSVLESVTPSPGETAVISEARTRSCRPVRTRGSGGF